MLPIYIGGGLLGLGEANILTLASIFSGIGGFELAATRHGIEPLWASEIDSTCISITRRHFPQMLHLGEVARLRGSDVYPVDVVSFGSPCQDLSVAGRRKGLDGERSAIFYEAMRIISEMRVASGGRYPTWVVWENVSGALFSSDGMDFRAVLGEFLSTEVPMPNSKRWATAGVVRGGVCDLAWRVLDAQYFGVPQRRRRVFLVADFAGKRAEKILFEPEGLRERVAPGEIERQGTATGIGDGIEPANDNVMVFDIKGGDGDCKASTLVGNNDKSLSWHTNLAAGFIRNQSEQTVGFGYSEQCAPTLRSGDSASVVYSCMTSNTTAHGLGVKRNASHTLDTSGKGQAICIDRAGFNQGRNAKFDFSVQENTTGTLVAEGPHAVAVPTDNRLAVRRLTPLECERLMGFPDNWTAHDKSGRPISDSRRYAAIGNSVAIPCVEYIMAGIFAANDT